MAEFLCHIVATIDGESYWWNGNAWDVEAKARTYSESAGERQLSILHRNNRYLESQDQAQNLRIVGAM
jgi:hypothetical protein